MVFVVLRVGQPLVVQVMHTGVKLEVNTGFIFRRLAQLRNEGCMLTHQSAGSIRIGKHDRLPAVFREHRKSSAGSAVWVRIDRYPELAQDSRRRRVQPLAGQSVGRRRIRFEQSDAITPSGVGKRTQAAHRPRADDGYVVAVRTGIGHRSHRKTLPCERRR